MTAAVNSMSTSATDSQKAAASNINNKVLIRKEADEEEEEAGLRQTDKRLPMGWILDQGPPPPPLPKTHLMPSQSNTFGRLWEGVDWK